MTDNIVVLKHRKKVIANFAVRLRKYMCSGFDKRSYGEDCVRGWGVRVGE